MCLAVPAQLIAVNDAIGTVELTGATRDCSLLLVPDAKVGDWLLVHAGFAVQIVDEEEAQKTLEAFKELEELEELTLQEKQHTADTLLRRINALHKPGETVRLMEVCGTHTVSIFREGLRQLLPSGMNLLVDQDVQYV